MKSLTLKLPKVKNPPEGKPSSCPRCSDTFLQCWGKTTKLINDIKVQEVQVWRFRCTSCLYTFRYYPEGVERKDQSQRTVVLVSFDHP